jgi:hypothetical protein
MALFGLGKKKKEEMPKEVPGALPTDQVMMMKQQGNTDDQIVQNLQNQGYNSTQIYDAINQVNISGQMPPQEQIPPAPQEQMQPPAMEGYGMQEQMPPHGYGPETQPQTQEPNQRIEEIAEVIIDEKWKELSADINKVIEWKEKTESRVTKLEQQTSDLRASIESLNKSLLIKITNYDQNITDVGTEIKAMEKVFQKVLPNLTENVNKLERLSKKPSSKK